MENRPLENENLIKLREKIDLIDNQIVELLAERFGIVKQIGNYKRKHNIPPPDSKRWNKVIQSKTKLAKKLNLNTNLVKKIYSTIHSYSIDSQKNKSNIIYGIQGGKGSFNEQAILEYIDKNKIKRYKILHLYTSKKVLKNLHEGNIHFGLFAITNSTGGLVEESIQALANFSVNIVADFKLLVRHYLMKRKDVKKKDLIEIMAHPQVFAQCKNTLKSKFSKYKLKIGKGDLVDTAKAAKYLVLGRLPKTTAILGPKNLSELYNLEIIDENLQDNKDNLTRFLLVKRR